MKKPSIPIIVLSGGILALFIRLLLIPNTGFEADISFWKSWGLAVMDFGMVDGLPRTNFNYPTPFGYLLFVMVKLYSLFADPYNFNQFWQNNNLPFLFISKAPAILADFGIAGILLYIGKHAKKLGFPPLSPSIYGLLAIVYLLNPISIIDGAWWGQLDSLGVFLFLLALVALLGRMPFVAGVIYMVAMMTKLQNMIYGPIFFLFLWQVSGWQGLLRGVGGALVTFLGLNVEFILARNFGRVIESVTGNYDYFPWLSLNAFNPWWIFSGAAGMKTSDKVLVVGLLNAKTLGLLLFSGAYLFAMLRQFIAKTLPLRTFLESFIIVNGAFFLFQTESHDRYAFPLTIVLLLWSTFFLAKRARVFALGYGLFSLFYFYNLHTALVFNYPHNGIPLLKDFVWPWLTIGTSFVFTGAFFVFLVWLARKNIWTILAPIALILLVVIAKNMPLITKKPVYITSLIPFAWKQDFGSRMINMPVNASLGFTNWSSLSVQYVFYRHGIGTHANGYQTFDIGGHFKQFTFDYGIDTEAGGKGSVIFEVWGDDKKLFTSEKITRFEYPRHAEVDVTGVKILKLVVTDTGDGKTDDHADWLNPKLIP